MTILIICSNLSTEDTRRRGFDEKLLSLNHFSVICYISLCQVFFEQSLHYNWLRRANFRQTGDGQGVVSWSQGVPMSLLNQNNDLCLITNKHDTQMHL